MHGIGGRTSTRAGPGIDIGASVSVRLSASSGLSVATLAPWRGGEAGPAGGSPWSPVCASCACRVLRMWQPWTDTSTGPFPSFPLTPGPPCWDACLRPRFSCVLPPPRIFFRWAPRASPAPGLLTPQHLRDGEPDVLIPVPPQTCPPCSHVLSPLCPAGRQEKDWSSGCLPPALCTQVGIHPVWSLPGGLGPRPASPHPSCPPPPLPARDVSIPKGPGGSGPRRPAWSRSFLLPFASGLHHAACECRPFVLDTLVQSAISAGGGDSD